MSLMYHCKVRAFSLTLADLYPVDHFELQVNKLFAKSWDYLAAIISYDYILSTYNSECWAMQEGFHIYYLI